MKIGDPRLPHLNPESQFSLMSWAQMLVKRLYDLFRSVDSSFDSMYQHRFVVPDSVEDVPDHQRALKWELSNPRATREDELSQKDLTGFRNTSPGSHRSLHIT